MKFVANDSTTTNSNSIGNDSSATLSYTIIIAMAIAIAIAIAEKTYCKDFSLTKCGHLFSVMRLSATKQLVTSSVI